MKKYFLSIITGWFAFPGILLANTEYGEVSTEHMPRIKETRRYDIEGGGYYLVSVDSSTYSAIAARFDLYNAEGKHVYGSNPDFNYALNGNPRSVGWGRTVLNFDENGNFLGEMYGREQSGQDSTAVTTPINSAIYSKGGKILSYDAQGNLNGAYGDLVDYIAQRMQILRGGNYVNIDLRDSDGNYYEKDSHGNITDAYFQNGTKSPHMSYKYDAGGNIVEKFENGKAVYQRKRYTIPEADAATQGKGPFTVTITW